MASNSFLVRSLIWNWYFTLHLNMIYTKYLKSTHKKCFYCWNSWNNIESMSSVKLGINIYSKTNFSMFRCVSTLCRVELQCFCLTWLLPIWLHGYKTAWASIKDLTFNPLLCCINKTKVLRTGDEKVCVGVQGSCVDVNLDTLNQTMCS